MVGKSICHVRGVRSILSFFLFLMENPVANNVDPDQMPHHVASDQSLHCLPMTLLWVSRCAKLKINCSVTVQTSQIQMRWLIMSRLIWIYSVCQGWPGNTGGRNSRW